MFGGASIDAHGIALTDETLAACQAADAVLLAAVGGPKWDTTDPDKPRPEQGLLGLRKGLGLFANLRPVKPLPALYDASPLKREVIEGTDLLVVRELTGGIYFGEKTRTPDRASDVCVYTRDGDRADRARRVRRREVARHQRRQGQRARDQPAVARGRARGPRRRVPEHRARAPARRQRGDAADRGAAALRRDPHREHVRRHPQRRGGDADRLDRDAPERLARRAGSPGLFEPVHGSAPDIAGTGAANPLAMFLSAAMMLRHGLGMEAQAAAIESAVDRALAEGLRTPRPGGHGDTPEATQAVLKHL